jgi:ATP-dependent Clp protease ATP-binding subunit ClpA
MRLTDMGILDKNRLAAVYRQLGIVVVPRVALPGGFRPPVADFFFLAVQDQCEVHISANTVYVGPDPQWRARLEQPEGPGHTRLVGAVRGDFFNGWKVAAEILEQAEGEPVEEPLEDGIPRPEVDAPRRRSPDVSDLDRPLLRDLVQACRGQPSVVIGRDQEMTALKTNLLRHSKPGVVLLGLPGVGKTALVKTLAAEMAEDRNLPPGLRNTPVYDLPLGMLRESARFVGDIERQARRLLNAPGRPIFLLDEIHQLAHPELKSLCDLIKPALATGSIRAIGATTPVEWRQIEDQAFKRRFLEIAIAEPSPMEAFAMVNARAQELAAHHGLEITEAMVHEAIMLAARYLPNRCFPDKAIDLLDQAAAMQAAANYQSVNQPGA